MHSSSRGRWQMERAPFAAFSATNGQIRGGTDVPLIGEFAENPDRSPAARPRGYAIAKSEALRTKVREKSAGSLIANM